MSRDSASYLMEHGYSAEQISRLCDRCNATIDELAAAVERNLIDEEPSDRVSEETFVKPEDFSDSGNADAFSKTFSGRILWTRSGGFYVWTGKRWEANDQKALGLAMAFTQAMLDDATRECQERQIFDARTGKTSIPEETWHYFQHAKKSRSAAATQHLLDLAKSRLVVDAASLDPNWWDLNSEAGIVDLRTGEIRKHDPLAYCTRMAPFAPGEGSKELWRDFLDTITDNDQSLKRHLQIVLGSMIIGRIFWEQLFIMLGEGRNGKSTFVNTCAKVIGDYATGLDAQVLTTDRQNRGAALATLRGRRMVVCGELEEGQRLSVQTLKRIASTDPLTIEEKYRMPETIIPTHHVLLFSNFLPRVGSTDAGTWRRISVIPFAATMPTGRDERLDYADILLKESGGVILSWLMDGARMFIEAGFRIEQPEVVRCATDAYRNQEDWLRAFLDERCSLRDDKRVRCGELYQSYQAYSKMTGDYCRRSTEFAQAMIRAGFSKTAIRGRWYWKGVGIDYAAGYSSGAEAAEWV